MYLFSDEYFMDQALQEAQLAFDKGEVPVGAVVVCQSIIIARSHNLTEHLHDATAHAEMQAITAASHHLNSKYLAQCTLFVTLEPCLMCAGALAWSQMGKVVWGANDPKNGFDTKNNIHLHPKTETVCGIYAQKSIDLLQAFFRRRRF